MVAPADRVSDVQPARTDSRGPRHGGEEVFGGTRHDLSRRPGHRRLDLLYSLAGGCGVLAWPLARPAAVRKRLARLRLPDRLRLTRSERRARAEFSCA